MRTVIIGDGSCAVCNFFKFQFAGNWRLVVLLFSCLTNLGFPLYRCHMNRFFPVLLSGLLLCSASAQAAEKSNITIKDLPVLQQEKHHKISCKRVFRELTEAHYRQDLVLDNKFYLDFFRDYLKSMDSYKVLFLQRDVDSYLKDVRQLKKSILGCELDLPYIIFNDFEKLKFEQLTYAISLLNRGGIDLTQDDEFQYDRSEEKWPATPRERQDLWTKVVKYDLIKLILSGKTEEEAVKRLIKRYRSSLNFLSQSQSEDVFSVFENTMAHAYDPHSNYMSPIASEEFLNDINLSLEGIGATLNSEDDTVTIVDLIPGGPAEKSKQLKPKDKIIGVGTSEKKIVDIVGIRLDEAVRLIRGPKGSTVYLQVQRGEGEASKIFVMSLVRDKIKMADRSASSEVINVEGRKIGVLKVSSFYRGLTADTRKELTKLKNDGVSAVVIDLRGNGGGLVTEATTFTGLFIKKGPVVQVRDRADEINSANDTDSDIFYSGPLVVLIDRLSASASEIFAAAMQDYGRGILVGGNSFGKGTVQQVTPLARFYDLFNKDMGQLSYTIAKFYRVNGGSTQLKGVAPDITFPSSYAYMKFGEKDMDNPLPWDSISAGEYSSEGNVARYVKALQARHEDRVKDLLDFKLLLEEVDEVRQIQDKKTVSLNLEKRRAKQKEDEARELNRVNLKLEEIGQPKIKKVADLPDDVKLPDVWKNEAAAIAADLASISGSDLHSISSR